VVSPPAGSRDERWWLNAFGSPRWWAGVFGVWTLFGVLWAGHARLRFNMDRTFVEWLFTMLPFYWAWVPLMPPVVILVSRFDFRSGQRLRSGLAHLMVAAGVIVCQSTLYAVILTLTTSSEWNAFTGLALGTVTRHGVGDLATYAALAGGILIVQQYRRAQARELEAAWNAIRASRLEAQLSSARLDALQMQLHPHFLFNALNSISVMVLKRAETEAIRAVRRLADLLRVTLHTAGTQELPLQEEIAFVQGYLEIEKLRFGDRLRVEFDVSVGVSAALVPHLILQPLVENAVIHGLPSRAQEGRIRVTARRDDDALRLEVWDNGAGPNGGEAASQGVGLANIRTRLQELYGDEARLSIDPAKCGGTAASIVLPYHTEAEPEPARPNA